MKLNQIADNEGARKERMRIGCRCIVVYLSVDSRHRLPALTQRFVCLICSVCRLMISICWH